MKTRIAAVDLGTLTVRLALAEVSFPEGLRILRHRREITALGRGLKASGHLDPEAREKTLKALREFAREMADFGVTKGQGVATEAVRQAADGQKFLQEAEKVLNLPLRLLTPEEEARLTLKGVLSALDPGYLLRTLLVFDVGGGSSEFTLVRPGTEPVFAGLALGVLSLSQARPLGDPPHPALVQDLQKELKSELGHFFATKFGPFLDPKPLLVGTAGAVTTLAALAQEMTRYDPKRINNFILFRWRLAQLRSRLASLPETERARLPGIEPAKAGVMVAGALLVEAILDGVAQDRLIVIDAGLLEGLLAELVSQ